MRRIAIVGSTEAELQLGIGLVRSGYAATRRGGAGRVPSDRASAGAAVFGLDEAVVLNDPLGLQRSGNAAEAAATVLASIRAHGGKAFDQIWMQLAFGRVWARVRFGIEYTALLLAPPLCLAQLAAAARDPVVARWWLHGVAEPKSLFAPIASEKRLRELLAATSTRPAEAHA